MIEWSNFFIAVAGAAAALTGLIFVGVSISLTKILSLPGLPDRALLSLILLLNVLVLSILFLVPGMTVKTLGLCVLIIGLVAWLIVFRLDFRNLQSKQPCYRRLYLFNMLIDQVATLCFVTAGIALLTGWLKGEYWMVPAVIVSIVKAIIDGWVLLVEINR